MFRSSKPHPGKYIQFPRHRRLVLDVCAAAKSVPKFSVDRRIDLTEVMAARKGCFQRIGWAAIFAKAYATVAIEIPELRQAFVSLPWPHLYQHPVSIANITVNRFDEKQQCDRLIWANIRGVDDLHLLNIQSSIDLHQHGEIEQLFREGRRLESLPLPLRKLAWHMLMRWMGRKRMRRLGSFTLSTLATYGTTNPSHPLLTTSSISYGPLDSEQCSTVTLQADHRVLDGVLAAKALVRLENVLHGETLLQLKSISQPQQPVRLAG